jgi:cyclic beta-1,2-glucan synthetase
VERLATDDADVPAEPVAPYRGTIRRRDRTTPPVVRVIRRLTSRLLDSEVAADRRAAALSPAESLKSMAPRGGSMHDRTAHESTPYGRSSRARRGPSTGEPLRMDNGLGGLTADDAYEIRLQGDALPPAPWSNVIANPRGGFVVTEQGGGFSWAANSYFFRLTPWHNDPVCDPVGEVVYLRDDETGDVWTPTPAARRVPASRPPPRSVC